MMIATDRSALEATLRLEQERNRTLRMAPEAASDRLNEWPSIVIGHDGREYDMTELWLTIHAALVRAGER